MDTIKLKNSLQFDPVYGCITMTYFPINLLILPILPIILLLKSERWNTSVLQLQYGFLVMCYVFIAFLVTVPLSLLLYTKILVNDGYIAFEQRAVKLKITACLRLVVSVFASPILIIVSLVVDLM